MNIKGIFTLIVTFLAVSALSESYAKPNSEILTPFLPLDPTPQPVTRYYDLVLTKTNAAPDGFIKEIFSINNQYPGPIIHANKGDKIVATVTNYLGVATAIHWHGMFQRGTIWNDGVVGLTQCPIPNGASYVYEFNTYENPGTYWYHAHFRGHYMEGLRAPLIIHDPDDPYRKSYNEEYVITLSDWYHQRISELLEKRMAPNYTGFNPIADSGLISGVGRYNCSAAPPGSKCQENNPLAVYKFTPGKKYRLRIINTSGLAHYIFSIDDHPLTIIEADGVYAKPVTVNKLPIAIGQRYSVIVEANKKVDNYWIRASIDSRCIPNTNVTINHDSAINYNVTGILRYNGAPETDPKTTEYPDVLPACLDVGVDLLKLLKPKTVPGPATDKILLNTTFGTDNKNIGRSFINNSSFVADITYPTIEKLVKNKVALNSLLPQENVYSYDTKNGVTDVYVINANTGTHPFHFHGHTFYVLGTGPGLVVDESKLNYKDPFARDVFVLNATSWSVFRYKSDNPGIWAMHCHIEWHVEMGMVAQLIELPSELLKFTLPPSVSKLCEQYSQKKDKRSISSRNSKRFNVDMKVVKV